MAADLPFAELLRAEAAKVALRLQELDRQAQAIRAEATGLIAKQEAMRPLLDAYQGEFETTPPVRLLTVDPGVSAPQAARRSGPPARMWTEERKTLLAELWPKGASSRAVADALNRLPGTAIEPKRVGPKAAILRIYRSPDGGHPGRRPALTAPGGVTPVPATRRPAGRVARFANKTSHPANREAACLPADHWAIQASASQFRTRVFAPADVPRVLISGENSAKVGKRVTKGPWAGMQLHTLTLEERATCPSSCGLLRECYGNAMPFARRLKHGQALVDRLDQELRLKAAEYPAGFVVRLHVLGDFYSEDYVSTWGGWLADIPQLRVFGYTAHQARTPIGAMLLRLNEVFAGRCAIRTSVEPDADPEPMQATTIWRQPEGRVVPEGTICPAMTGGTEACATCGLCWHPVAAARRIVFIGHGMTRRSSDAQPLDGQEQAA